MSYSRSPRAERSTTVGMSGMAASLVDGSLEPHRPSREQGQRDQKEVKIVQSVSVQTRPHAGDVSARTCAKRSDAPVQPPG